MRTRTNGRCLVNRIESEQEHKMFAMKVDAEYLPGTCGTYTNNPRFQYVMYDGCDQDFSLSARFDWSGKADKRVTLRCCCGAAMPGEQCGRCGSTDAAELR